MAIFLCALSVSSLSRSSPLSPPGQINAHPLSLAPWPASHIFSLLFPAFSPSGAKASHCAENLVLGVLSQLWGSLQQICLHSVHNEWTGAGKWPGQGIRRLGGRVPREKVFSLLCGEKLPPAYLSPFLLSFHIFFILEIWWFLSVGMVLNCKNKIPYSAWTCIIWYETRFWAMMNI